MALLDIFRSDDDNDERPPKPDPEHRKREIERTRYTAIVEYRNEDREHFECYGIHSRGDEFVKFNTDPYGREDYLNRKPSYTYDRRKIHYETLAREPKLTEEATDRFVITGDVDWEWDRPRGLASLGGKDWRANVSNVSLEVVRDIDTDE